MNKNLQAKLFLLIQNIEQSHFNCLQKKFICDENILNKYKIRFLKVSRVQILTAKKEKNKKEALQNKEEIKKEIISQKTTKKENLRITRKLKKQYEQIKSKIGKY